MTETGDDRLIRRIIEPAVDIAQALEDARGILEHHRPGLDMPYSPHESTALLRARVMEKLVAHIDRSDELAELSEDQLQRITEERDDLKARVAELEIAMLRIRSRLSESGDIFMYFDQVGKEPRDIGEFIDAALDKRFIAKILDETEVQSGLAHDLEIILERAPQLGKAIVVTSGAIIAALYGSRYAVVKLFDDGQDPLPTDPERRADADSR